MKRSINKLALLTCVSAFSFLSVQSSPMAFALRPHNAALPINQTQGKTATPLNVNTNTPSSAVDPYASYQFTPLKPPLSAPTEVSSVSAGTVSSMAQQNKAKGASLSSNPLPTIEALEDSLYDTRYDTDSVDIRLSRIENTIFGQSKSKQPLEKRLQPLQQILATEQAKNNLPQANRSASKGSAMRQNQPPKAMSPKPAAGENDYPVVGIMEKKLYDRTFEKEDITVRLDRLDNQVFHSPQSGELADRVDNLRDVVLGDNPNAESSPLAGVNNQMILPNGKQAPYHAPPQQWTPPNSIASNSPGSGFPGYYPAPGFNPNGGGAGNSSYNTGDNAADLSTAMSEMEKQVLGKTYPQDNINSRLDRMEMKVFKSTSPELSASERVQRIVAVASANGTPQTGKQKAKSTFFTILPIILTLLPLVLL